MAHALREGLRLRTLHCVLRVFDQRPTRREKHPRHNATDNRAMETLVVRKVLQNWIGAAARLRELHGTTAEPALQLVQIGVESRARIADQHE